MLGLVVLGWYCVCLCSFMFSLSARTLQWLNTAATQDMPHWTCTIRLKILLRWEGSFISSREMTLVTHGVYMSVRWARAFLYGSEVALSRGSEHFGGVAALPKGTSAVLWKCPCSNRDPNSSQSSPLRPERVARFNRVSLHSKLVCSSFMFSVERSGTAHWSCRSHDSHISPDMFIKLTTIVSDIEHNRNLSRQT